ncbi:hypothetical protein [Nocardioides rubriscoriae]|uniref:hypothetical protein n=1 Tax=Nocardioides rubriscoriae TaxID=642762 RepID=UPI0011E0110D|nr:hypothetical protein [Nocardioides rubriscoriae]
MHDLADEQFSDTTLVVTDPIWDLPDDVRTALEQWCHDHHVDPELLLVDRPIERDPHAVSLSWYVETPTGVQRRIVYEAEPRGSWPEPFPDVVRAWCGRRRDASLRGRVRVAPAAASRHAC